jgi:hypothetical protein
MPPRSRCPAGEATGGRSLVDEIRVEHPRTVELVLANGRL